MSDRRELIKAKIKTVVQRLMPWELDKIVEAMMEPSRDKTMDGDAWKSMLEAVIREVAKDKYDRYPKVWSGIENAPGHAHQIKGVWDSDNGSIAGTDCSWCIAWNEARKALT